MLIAAALLAAMSCQPASDGGQEEKPAPDAAAPTQPVELFTWWWTRTGDTDPLGALIAVHEKRHPGSDVRNASSRLSGRARKTLVERMWHQEPPDAFQANVGWDLMRWVIVNGLDTQESMLAPVDDIMAAQGVDSTIFPDAVTQHLTLGGHLYGIPADLHRINEVFYSHEVFRKYGLTEPRSLDDLFALGEKLAGEGVPLLAIGSKDPWTLAVLTLECVLVAQAGPTFYTKYFSGALEPDTPEIRKALRTVLRLSEYMNDNQASISWIQALKLVQHGRAAMTVMGDWARVALQSDGAELGRDFGELPFPGSASTFVFTSDIFAIPKDAPNQSGARLLLDSLLSPEGQAAIHGARHALPARLDVPLSSPDPVLEVRRDLAKSGSMVLAQSGIVPARFAADVNAALAEMLKQRDIEPALLTLRSRYVLLR